MSQPPSLFPALEKLIERTDSLARPKGNLAAKLPRILGQGKTRAEGLDLPPATIERQQELLSLNLPDDTSNDPEVQKEIASARKAAEEHKEFMRHLENQRRFALQALQKLADVATGRKDNQFFAGRLVLVPDASGQNWAWSMTAHYPVISKIPADVDYIVSAFEESERIIEKWTLPTEQFLDRLNLAWMIARHRSKSDNVFIADVAKFFKLAAQNDGFWGNPSRRFFEDVPEAVFIANLINWRRQRDPTEAVESFELKPATLNQAHGPNSRAFYVPANPEGTAVTPMIYIRRHQK
jgi:hypothetical protein